MKKHLSRLLSLILVLALCCGCSTGKTAAKRPQLSTNFTPREITYSFSALPSQSLRLSSQGAAAVLDGVAQVQPVYTYAHLYRLDEVKNRLQFSAAVDSHSASALNARGKLEGAHLATLVKANNEAFLSTKPFGYTAVEDDYIAQLCDFIVTVVDAMMQKYPSIDWDRVSCNLGNLKILYDTGMLSYAQVTQEMVLAISKNNTEIVLNMKGADGFTRVLTHEIMHILQIGCVCESIPNCGRRAGIALYWDDFTLNTTDWTWMVEGSAERLMCTLTGGEAISYQYKMDYLCSLTMSVLLREDVQADTMETLCFYSDPQLLFDAFGCQTQAQQDELLNMMITLQILQMQPTAFHQLYREETGIDLTADSDAMDQFSYSLKPAICITLAREFYRNLVPALQSGQLSCNDLFCLINLFEGHLDQHLNFTNPAKADINAPFLTAYTTLRTALFDALQQDNPTLNLAQLYSDYAITAKGDGLLNAQLTILPAEKRAFLAERAQWQADNLSLGRKVP